LLEGMHMRRRAGYSLIELTIVLTLIGLMAAITFVRVAPTLERTRVRGAANVVAGDLQYAQALAARDRIPIVFSVNTSTKVLQLRNRSGTTIYRERQFGSGGTYDLSEFAAVPASMELYPNGVASQSTTFTVGVGNNRRRVTMTVAGQIRVTVVN